MMADGDIAELSTVIHAELIRAGLADLSPTMLAAALRLLASDICEDYPTAE